MYCRAASRLQTWSSTTYWPAATVPPAASWPPGPTTTARTELPCFRARYSPRFASSAIAADVTAGMA